MASVEVPVTVCTSFKDQNLGGSNENMCKKCWEMENHLEMLISELKSTRLIIKMLQEDIKLASTDTRNQANLTDHVEHSINGKNCPWKEVSRTRTTATKLKKYNRTNQMGTVSFPLSSNHYDPLSSYSEDDDTPTSTVATRLAKPRHTEKRKMNHKKRGLKKKQRKVMIFGDSHARGCAAELSHLLKKDFEVLGFVSPGSGLKHIKDTSMGKLQQLSKEDVVVLWGGSNDIAKNNSSEGMKHLLELVMNATHTNVILMSAPNRFDLMETSCVNHEIENFNRKLRKRLERLGKVEMIDIGNDRNLFTRHGQDLNSVGKECMANKIASTIECALNKKVEPISEKWYTDNETPASPTSTANEQGKRSDDEDTKVDSNYNLLDEDDKKEVMEDTVQGEAIHMRPRISKRQKKPPTKMSENFLW